MRNKFRCNKENITSRLFAQNKRRPSHYDDEDEDEEDHHGGGIGAGTAMGLGAGGLALANQGLSAMGTIQGVREQAGGIKGWWDKRKRRKADYKKYGGDEHLMEKKRDQAYRLSKNAKNSAQEAALKHRESEIADSLNYARKKNAYKNEMATNKSWVGKGTTWAKHNPWQAGAGVAGTAALAGGAYYLWKKRQEKKKREKERREREAQTRHQSNITSRMFGTQNARLGKVLSGVGRSNKVNSFKRSLMKNRITKRSNMRTPAVGYNYTMTYTPKTQTHKPANMTYNAGHNNSYFNNSHSSSIPAVQANRVGNTSRHQQTANSDRTSNRDAQRRIETNHDAFKLHDDRMKARKAKERKEELNSRREAKQNDQARRDKANQLVHERDINRRQSEIDALDKKTQELKTADKGVWSDDFKRSRKELRNKRIDLHNAKYKDNKLEGIMARAGGLKKFDKYGNLRWGKKRMALAGLGAYAAYNMMKDDDDDK